MNAAKQRPRTASEVPRPSKSERILVVKEEETSRELIVSMLTRAGYECQEARDGLEALALLDSTKGFDLLLAGLTMPNLDGIALVEHTKAKYPDLPVVIVAVDLVQLALLALHSGAYEYLSKPFEEEQLLATVRRALEYRRLKLANREYEKKLGTLTIPTAHHPERILVQDDEETIREIVSSVLISSLYECRGVASPKEALDILSSGEQFDLILCGLLETQEVNFFERMGERFPDIPLVVLSACHSFALFLPALRDGAYDYLMKPFEREQLLIVVRRALDYRRLKLENRDYKARPEKRANEESHGSSGSEVRRATPMPDRILVVDDEEVIREIVSSMLKGAHFQTRQAANGVEAFALLDSGEEFGLVLTGLMVPKMDGIALLERAKGRFPDMPIVIVAAVHDFQVALQALRNGAYDYLLKPFEREQLLATVRRALEKRRLQRENDDYRTNLEALVADRTQQWRTALSELEKSYDILLEALGDKIGARDSETERHSKRVTAYSIAIARKMGLTKEEIDMIARGAFLHDNGKMAIPDAILLTPGKLTDDEMAIMREHAYLGYKMLSKIPFLAEAAEIVHAHHERYDGTGYPRGLKGMEIPLGARLVALANTLDSITSDLPYRHAQSFEAARKEIELWSGRQFDPEIVKVFLEMPDHVWEGLRKDINAANTSLPKV